MGYELVEVECVFVGLLCVYIDQVENGIVIEDCEKVSYQFMCVFEVENVNYEWLEVLLLGLDCLLCMLVDFMCFVGFEVKVMLCLLVGG